MRVAEFVEVFAGYEIADVRLLEDEHGAVVEDRDERWRARLDQETGAVLSLFYGTGPLRLHVNRGGGYLLAALQDLVALLTFGRIKLSEERCSKAWIEFVRVDPKRAAEVLREGREARRLALAEAERRGLRHDLVRVSPQRGGSTFGVCQERVWHATVENGQILEWRSLAAE
ncbi:MAG: hypothetical protein KC910_27145 [Candidatus Eremiobacteraeota bacterium]|nr:hypothetical protein [Candidatus Eremiobacteraeota bacterium]